MRCEVCRAFHRYECLSSANMGAHPSVGAGACPAICQFRQSFTLGVSSPAWEVVLEWAPEPAPSRPPQAKPVAAASGAAGGRAALGGRPGEGLDCSALPARAAFEAFARREREASQAAAAAGSLQEPRGRLDGAAAPASSAASAEELCLQLGRVAQDAARLARAPDGPREVAYELSRAPGLAAMAESSRLSALEAGLAAIERQLAPLPAASAEGSDLAAAVAQLQRRLSLLEPEKLDAVRSGAQRMLSGIEAAPPPRQRPSAPGDPEPAALDRRVAELHEECCRWGPGVPALPALAARLGSLQVPHREGLAFATRLSALEDQQDEMARVLRATSAAVQELRRGMRENMAVMRENLHSLEERIPGPRRAPEPAGTPAGADGA